MINKLQRPKISRTVVTTANVEKSVYVSAAIAMKIQAVSSTAGVRVAFTTGVVANGDGNYWSVKKNTVLTQDYLYYTGNVYFATVTGVTSEPVQVLYWQ